MTNPFYLYGIIWSTMLILYVFSWSNLCTPLPIGLWVFLIITIQVSFLLGYLFRKKLRYIKLEKAPLIPKKYICIIVGYFILEMTLSRKIPVLAVIQGMSYADVEFQGIPILHNIMSSIAIVYSFYLSYVYANYKKNKSALLYCLIIVLIFICLMQRQNVLICLLGLINFLVLDFRQKKHRFKAYHIILFVIAALLLLYGFGIFGNIRYGSMWKWYDTSMIEALGRINNSYPGWIPKQYFWTYIYIVGPLVNLNYNITHFTYSPDFFRFVMEFIPDFIKLKLGYVKTEKILPVSSLTASTSYTFVYRYAGFFGMYLMYCVNMVLAGIEIKIGYKKRKQYLMVIDMCSMYLVIFSFFTNTIAYTISSMVFICGFALALAYKFKIKMKLRII